MVDKKEDLIPGKTYYYYLIMLKEPYVNLEYPNRNAKITNVMDIFSSFVSPCPVVYNRSYYFTKEDGGDVWCSNLSRIYENLEDCIKDYNDGIDLILDYVRRLKGEIIKISKAEVLL